MLSSSVFSSWNLLHNPTYVRALGSLPRTFWKERREAQPLHLAKHLSFSTGKEWRQLQQGYVLIAWHLFSTFSWIALLWAGTCPWHRGSQVSPCPPLSHTAGRGGKEQRRLHFLPPSVLVLIVKHRSPTVTVDHIQSKGRF